MPYTILTLGDAKSDLAERLNDPDMVFWTDSELQLYIYEALRTWNAYAGFYRATGTITTVEDQAWYDFPVTLTDGSDLLLERTVTDRDLLLDLEYALIEPPTTNWASPSPFSDLFSLQDLDNSIRDQRNEFLERTGVILTRSSQVCGAPIIQTVPLDQSISAVRRAAWVTVEGVYRTLWVTDEYGMTSFYPNWPIDSASKPLVYMLTTVPTLELQFGPTVNDIGTLELITIQCPSGAFDPTVSATLLNIPNDLAWSIKWGVLARQLGKDGRSYDPQRSQYCDERWQQALKLSTLMPTVLRVHIEGRAVSLTSLKEMDAFSPTWQNESGPPERVVVAGPNLIALHPIPDDEYTITFSVIRNAPLPADDDEYLQLGREHINYVLDYAQHLASFKMGGAEFQMTLPLYESMLEGAMKHNEQLRAYAQYFTTLQDRGSIEQGTRPQFVPAS